MEKNNLIVGLGGSGGKIIRHIRKTIERNGDAYGPAGDQTRFEFLYADTSTDELDRRDEWKVLGKEVDLDRAQVLINTASNIRPVLDDPRSFPGLEKWIEPREIFDFVKPGIAGAAQRRKLGRVVFAQNADRFVTALGDRVHQLEQRSGRTGVTFHVVCGLAGGTGSGSVVDTVALIRHRYPDQENYRILIYALLPEKNSKRVKDVAGFSTYYGNGYAALAELSALAVGAYQPVNVLDGSTMTHDVYFNGCYLINNVNENHLPFDIETEVPRLVADFIYQKSLNDHWGGLSRAEKGENDIINFESEDGKKKDRAKLFLSFGMKRVVVPEQEIKEYLAYGLAEQATRQLMYNNFRQGEGYADEALEKDWGAEARKPETLQAFLLSDANLTLEAGILEDDIKNANWKSFHEFWKQVVGPLALDIKADKTLDETDWIHSLNKRIATVYDGTYRMMGGVRKFYEVKGNARLEMARHIARQIEKELFSRWKIGSASLIQLRQLVDALVATLEEKATLFSDALAKGPSTQAAMQQRIKEFTLKFDKVGTLKRILTDERESLFSAIALISQDLLTLNTRLEGQRFAFSLIPFITDQLVSLRGTLDELHQTLARATEMVHDERAARLGSKDLAFQTRIFDIGAITKVLKALIVDEAAQVARTQKVRAAIIEIAGADVDSFDKLRRAVSLSGVIATLSQTSAAIVELAHGEVTKLLPPVLHVNIVERLQKQYDANPNGLKAFVSALYDESGTMLQFSKPELGKQVAFNTGGSRGAAQTVGVYLPECESQKEFHAALTNMFDSQKDPTSETSVRTGRLSNEIVIMKIVSLMPARFVESLPELKRHYDGLLKDDKEAHLLHSSGDGRRLPSLFARSAAELLAEARQKPYRLVANLLGMIKQRPNTTSGMTEWVLVYTHNGLPKTAVLNGSRWNDVLHSDLEEDLQERIEREVKKRIDADYKHIDKKGELLTAFRSMALMRYNETNESDPEYIALSEMQPMVREIIGIPASYE